MVFLNCLINNSEYSSKRNLFELQKQLQIDKLSKSGKYMNMNKIKTQQRNKNIKTLSIRADEYNDWTEKFNKKLK